MVQLDGQGPYSCESSVCLCACEGQPWECGGGSCDGPHFEAAGNLCPPSSRRRPGSRKRRLVPGLRVGKTARRLCDRMLAPEDCDQSILRLVQSFLQRKSWTLLSACAVKKYTATLQYSGSFPSTLLDAHPLVDRSRLRISLGNIARGTPWFVYFKHSHYTTFRPLDQWIRMRLPSFAMNGIRTTASSSIATRFEPGIVQVEYGIEVHHRFKVHSSIVSRPRYSSSTCRVPGESRLDCGAPYDLILPFDCPRAGNSSG